MVATELNTEIFIYYFLSENYTWDYFQQQL